MDNNLKNSEYEYRGPVVNGFLMLVIVVAIAAGMFLYFTTMAGNEAIDITVGVIGAILLLFFTKGYFTQEPNEARVLIFFGKYAGTCRRVGFYWVNPLLTRRKLSLRIRNMDIEPIKVNDKIGNPVLIGMVLVWRIKDTYRAVFDLDSASLGGVSAAALQAFVRIQSDAALREVTGHYAYDQTGVADDE
ncbi:MAG: SPFH domain-containing protein, partial [Muribaculaceae bacterium]|nr:SPFH domain-containing protein [Muribaculaceae bacterium]